MDASRRKTTTEYSEYTETKESIMGLLYERESYQILGACFEVYKEKGAGFLEGVYQECLEIEFGLQQNPFMPKRRWS